VHYDAYEKDNCSNGQGQTRGRLVGTDRKWRWSASVGTGWGQRKYGITEV